MSKSLRQSRRESMISRSISQNYRDLPLIEQALEAANAANAAAARGDDAEDSRQLMIEAAMSACNESRRSAAIAALRRLPQAYQAAGEDNAGSSSIDMAQERGCWNKYPAGGRAIECCEYWELALASARDSMQGDGYDQQAAQYAADESAAGLVLLADAALGR